MSYDNSEYWTGLHKKYGGRLAAVGYPNLSEKFNELKYESEADTVLLVLRELTRGKFADRRELKILDVGAGTGYWTHLVEDFLRKQEIAAKLSVLDISDEALEGIKKHLPQVEPIQGDLKTISPDRFRDSFDMVYSFYCLHHLPRLQDFLNALQFSARSVAPGGLLIVMDPILHLPYSRLDSFDYAAHSGNGVVRHLHLIEDVLANEQFSRLNTRPAVSFLLNSNIEARSRATFAFCNWIWERLQPFYRSDRGTRWVAPIIRSLDKLCKRRQWAYSSSVCVFQKNAVSKEEQ